MGVDKAALELDGRPQLERAYAALAAVADPVYVSVRAEQSAEPLRARFPQLVDEPGTAGPAAGLLAAHRAAPEVPWLVLAVDMPLVTSAVLRELIAARDPACDATAWRASTDGRPEPLCAIYEAATLARFAAGGGAGSPRHWLEQSRVKYLANASSELLQSTNTPAELERLTGFRRAQTGNRKSHDQ